MRKVVVPLVIASLLAATPARPQAQSEACKDVGRDALADAALDQIKKESPWASLGGLNSAKSVADAYLAAPEGKKTEAIGKALAEVGVTLAVPGTKVLIVAGKISVLGVEWTIAAAESMATEADLCGGVSSGSQLQVEGVFKTPGAQAIAPGITCENYADWLNTPEKFEKFRTFFKGHFTRTMGAMGISQTRFDRQWAVIEPTWQVREAERKLQQLQRDLARRLDEEAKKAASKPCPPPTELGADNTDPAKLPEPELPPGGLLVLVETKVTPHSLDPSMTVSAAPQRNRITSYWGEATCVWSAPPKSLVNGEVFGFDFSIAVASKNQQRYSEGLTIRSGFANVNSLPNEIYVAVEPGEGKSANGHLELGTGDLSYAEDYMTWWLSVGGCGGNVDYMYKFRKP